MKSIKKIVEDSVQNNKDEIVNQIHKKRMPLIINILKTINKKKNKIVIKGFCLIKIFGTNEHDTDHIKVLINNEEYKIKFKIKNGIPFIKKYRFNLYKIEIPLKKIIKMDIQNKIQIAYKDLNYGRIIYNCFDLLKGKNKNSKIIHHNDKSIYLRQTPKNTMYLTIREENKYDYLKGKIKILSGYILSKFLIKKDILLFFEKESSRYEESASVVYEKLIDEGYQNAYYILNKDNPKYKNLHSKYKKNIIFKDSLKHIIYFFKCQKFIGSEDIAHSMQLRIANKLVIDKYNKKNIMYVFLQHGVMYMVSLNSDLRTGFSLKNIKLHRIVTSSKEEAKHFIDLGGFKEENLYICGLPKFDKAIKSEAADKIVIMPTWRRWEANEASIDYENTKYYKMIQRIFNSVPKNLKDKVIILPHPLMLKEIKHNKEYKKYIPSGDFTYDDILKECKLLITDYSSIAYDAFYRGSNVIFYWEEKEECMKKYGENTILMLNDSNCFGDICYNIEELSEIIEKNYNNIQNENYKKKFKKIVQFDDNKNTERLIELLKKDQVL